MSRNFCPIAENMYWNPRRVVKSAKVFWKVDLCWNSVHSCLSCGTSLSPTGAWVNWTSLLVKIPRKKAAPLLADIEVAVSSSASLAVAGISGLLGRPQTCSTTSGYDLKKESCALTGNRRADRANHGELWLNNTCSIS